MPEYCKIDLETTINSGQVFLWKKYQSNWYGINGQDILKINDSGEIKSYSNQKIDYFREKDDLEKILRSISIDPTTKKAVKKFFGLRLLRQDPFQCFISFIVSSNSSIQKIKKCLENICKSFGKKVIFDGREFFLFPESKTLAAATFQEVRSCGVGYRSNFIIKASEMVYSNKINFQYLQNCEYIKAKDLISKVPGIGDKVADCILLFSLDKLEAFPLDRWMIRVLGKYYPNTFTLLTKNITHKQYELLHEKIVNHFGPFAGYTQQFLFKMERENYKKKWL
ncbi:MAG: DNA repair protein [Nitrosopumilus sp.]|nr:DNA repair protein [Nitrosopumilus sp.]